MKLTLLSLLSLLAVAVAVPSPNPKAQPNPQKKVIAKRSVTATVTADALKYRTCPRTSCTAVGQFSRGTRVTVECLTDTDTTTVEGNPFWSRLSNGFYAADFYLDWSGTVPQC